ncbi:Small GTPase superfamily [Macleaya cordata]|uniref:Mitochondrial Rho GTPase n=1 Tax=Macleaya cordata TaxID=56857 RepID=A0A200Q4Y5_MACCD|nr:Small GTPase superfamily [Macleaya cordata]
MAFYPTTLWTLLGYDLAYRVKVGLAGSVCHVYWVIKRLELLLLNVCRIGLLRRLGPPTRSMCHLSLMENSTGKSNSGDKANVRVVVVGDHGTGKSSLIVTAAAETFPQNVPPVLPPTRLPADFYPDRVPVTIIDTSSSLENRIKLAQELRLADAVVLTYACDQPATLDRLSTFWLPELRRLEVKVPVIVVGCKLDAREDTQVSLEQVMSPIMQQFREIETCIECSARNLIQVPEVFYYAQKAVLHPTAPLFDQETQTLKPRCVRALKRIFILCDHDRDGALSDRELNDFQQVKCFNAPLQPSEIVGVKRVVQEKLSEGVNDRGLTLTGFLFLHALFIEKGRLETTWTVLRKFGYDNEIKLRDDLLPVSCKRAPDQSVELTNEAVEFLRGIFSLFDLDGDGALRPAELDDLFSTAPESPWSEAPFKDSAEKTALGGLSLDGFLSEWALMTLLDPAKSLANLIYIGYAGDPASTLRITRRRRLDRKKQQSDRNVFQCFVFGPKGAGKSALLNSFLGRPFSETYSPTTNERFATNTVDHLGGNKKTLILREIPEDGVKRLLSNKESLAACDVAIFVHDSSDEKSWKRATELLVEVASHVEDSGFEVPCLIVAAKDDLDPFPLAIQNSTRVSQDMGIEAPIPVSMQLGDLNNVFRRIISAAEHPHLSIPETEAGRNRKQYRQLVNRSLMFVSVGAAVAIVGLAAYRVYAARKNASG